MQKSGKLELRQKINGVVSWAYKNPAYIAFAIIILLAILVISIETILKAAVISFLIIIGGISKIYQRYTHVALGVELVMFSTIVAGFVYGPLIGAVVGFSSFALATYFSSRYTFYVVPSLIIYALSGMFASYFSSVAIAGILANIVFVIILSYVSIAFFGSRLNRVFMFAFTSLLWNFWIFLAVAPRIVELLA